MIRNRILSFANWLGLLATLIINFACSQSSDLSVDELYSPPSVPTTLDIVSTNDPYQNSSIGFFANASSGFCIDVPESTLNVTQLIQWTCSSELNQLFELKPSVRAGVYSIVSRISGKCLDIQGDSLANGAPVIQYACNGSDNQLFLISSGTLGFQIVAQHSQKCIMVNDSVMGSKLVQGACTTSMNDKRYFWSHSTVSLPPPPPPQTKSQVWQRVAKRTQAQKTAGLSGGEGWQMIFDISYAPSNPNIVYFVTDTNQVWKSTNGGTTWDRRANGFLASGGISLVVDPTNENIVYVAGSLNMGGLANGEDFLNPVQGIIRTIDGGNSWSLVTSFNYGTFAPQAKFHRVAGWGGRHFAFAGNTIYSAPGNTGLLKSTNGTIWTAVLKAGGGKVLDTEELHNIIAHPTNNTILYVSSTSGLYKVVDVNGFATVTKLGGGLPAGAAWQAQIPSSSPNTIYVAMASNRIYRSTDGGATFSARNNGLPAGDIRRMAVSPANANKLIVTYRWGGHNLYYTNDGGENWIQTSSMDEQNANGWVAVSTFINQNNNYYRGINDQNAPIAFHPTDQNIALVNGWGSQIKKTKDGGVNWGYSGNGYVGATASQYGSVPIGWDSTSPSRATFFHSDYGPMVTLDGEDTFRNINTSWNGRVASLAGAMRGNIIVAAIGPYTSQRIHVSRDSGSSWTPVSGADDNFFFVNFHPQNSNIAYAGPYKFTNIQTGNTFTTLTKSVRGVFKGNGNVVYSYGGGVIYKSIDRGSTWTNPYPTINGSISQIAIDPTDENRIYAAVRGSGIYIITNTIANGGVAQLKNEAHGLAKDQFGSVNAYSVVTDPNNSNIVYAGALKHNRGQSNGIFRSTDSGVTWSNISGNLGPQFNVVNLAVNPHNSYIYIDSYSGTWKLPPPLIP